MLSDDGANEAQNPGFREFKDEWRAKLAEKQVTADMNLLNARIQGGVSPFLKKEPKCSKNRAGRRICRETVIHQIVMRDIKWKAEEFYLYHKYKRAALFRLALAASTALELYQQTMFGLFREVRPDGTFYGGQKLPCGAMGFTRLHLYDPVQLREEQLLTVSSVDQAAMADQVREGGLHPWFGGIGKGNVDPVLAEKVASGEWEASVRRRAGAVTESPAAAAGLLSEMNIPGGNIVDDLVEAAALQNQSQLIAKLDLGDDCPEHLRPKELPKLQEGDFSSDSDSDSDLPKSLENCGAKDGKEVFEAAKLLRFGITLKPTILGTSASEGERSANPDESMNIKSTLGLPKRPIGMLEQSLLKKSQDRSLLGSIPEDSVFVGPSTTPHQVLQGCARRKRLNSSSLTGRKSPRSGSLSFAALSRFASKSSVGKSSVGNKSSISKSSVRVIKRSSTSSKRRRVCLSGAQIRSLDKSRPNANSVPCNTSAVKKDVELNESCQHRFHPAYLALNPANASLMDCERNDIRHGIERPYGALDNSYRNLAVVENHSVFLPGGSDEGQLVLQAMRSVLPETQFAAGRIDEEMQANLVELGSYFLSIGVQLGLPMSSFVQGFRGAPSIEEFQKLEASFCLKVMPHQWEAVRWLAGCYLHGHSALLCDEMGLGKTVSCLSFLEWVDQTRADRVAVLRDSTSPAKKRKGRGMLLGRRPHLIICPANLVDTWVREVRQLFGLSPYRDDPLNNRFLQKEIIKPTLPPPKKRRRRRKGKKKKKMGKGPRKAAFKGGKTAQERREDEDDEGQEYKPLSPAARLQRQREKYRPEKKSRKKYFPFVGEPWRRPLMKALLKSKHFPIWITTPETLHREREFFLENRFDVLVIDEATRLKNPKSLFHQSICELEFQMTILVTGIRGSFLVFHDDFVPSF